MPRLRSEVHGPAYLDRVLRVDRPLIDPRVGGVVDRSAGGRIREQPGASTLRIACLPGLDFIVSPLPEGWPGPFGLIVPAAAPDRSSPDTPDPTTVRRLEGIAARDDLGGMGAGYAKALGARLTWLAGAADDPTTAAVQKLLADEGILSRPIRLPDKPGEWTLLVTSGPHGDKLAVGFRSFGDSAPPLEADDPAEPPDLLVAASMTNRRVRDILASTSARVRMFAPSIRNMLDRDPAVSSFAGSIDILCCNALEWESAADREEIAWRVSILAVTDGPRGAVVRFTDPVGEPGRITVPAFPRTNPPRDTNRAGEAFASTLVSTLIEQGWTPGTAEASLVALAAERASAAAALVLDRLDFGFPTSEEIDRALAEGIVRPRAQTTHDSTRPES
ncbi:MAG: carbohydrate kinase family protein [Isosphaeraceae bacterium]|nr:carbohydrate kinase family protein [Isosphaeraceae bacterium]